MWPFPPRATTFVGARIHGPDGTNESSLRIVGDRIEDTGGLPKRGDAVIDLRGAIILPGLINAHDHLGMNNFPRLKWRSRYCSARDWIADFQPRFKTDPSLSAAMSVALKDRLILGGLKNLLSGVTTVCHHDPPYRELWRKYPVRVVRQVGYSHSLLMDGTRVKLAYKSTPGSWPWVIHAAEGTDALAAGEFAQLERWGCLGANTVLVHGVALGEAEQQTLIDRGAALIWCPSSNDFLLGGSVDVSRLLRARRVILGTDSRLSGERDLLAEMKYAADHYHVDAADLLRMVTADAASALKLSDAGAIRPGASADMVILPTSEEEPAASLLATSRAGIRLVLIGRAQVGDPDMLPVFVSSNVKCERVRVDRHEKLMSKSLVDTIRTCSVREPGLSI